MGLLLPFWRHLPGFDLGVLFAAVALLGHFHKGGVDDAAFLGEHALAAQVFVEALEEFAEARFGADLLAEFPKGFLIGHTIGQGEAEEAHKAQILADLALQGLVGEVV